VSAQQEHSRPLFNLGRTVATPGALRLLADAGVDPFDLLTRHVHGDWGDLDPDDKRQNDIAVESGAMRVFSSYLLSRDGMRQKVWVITEWDRSVTTMLLPQEY
jgi:hypothetical protein